MEEEREFRLKAYGLSKGASVRMSEVTPQKFEYGENVKDTRTGRQGQVHLIIWGPTLEGWRYCIARKDVDNLERYVDEPDLMKAPAQTRIDNAKAIRYAPKKLKRRAAPHRRSERFDWASKRLTNF